MGSDPRLERLKLALCVHVAQMIVDADDVLDYSEIELLSREFPTSMLKANGFVDEKGRFTEGYDEARRIALQELPGMLRIEDKFALIDLFYRACLADGELHPRELGVMVDASALLGVDRATLQQHLDLQALGPGAATPPVRKKS